MRVSSRNALAFPPRTRPATSVRVVPTPDTDSFIARWSSSGAAERANYQLFLSELCDLIGVARPDPTKPDDAENAYVFERNVTFHHADGSTSTGRIDLYKRGCYVLEAKQGVEKREAAEALAEATKAKAPQSPSGSHLSSQRITRRFALKLPNCGGGGTSSVTKPRLSFSEKQRSRMSFNSTFLGSIT